MSKKRVSDLAKDYGMKGPELVELLKRAGFDRVKNHMTQLDDAELMLATAVIETQRPKSAAEGSSEAAAEDGDTATEAPPARGMPRKKSLPPPVVGKDTVKEPPRRKLGDKPHSEKTQSDRPSALPADHRPERLADPAQRAAAEKQAADVRAGEPTTADRAAKPGILAHGEETRRALEIESGATEAGKKTSGAAAEERTGEPAASEAGLATSTEAEPKPAKPARKLLPSLDPAVEAPMLKAPHTKPLPNQVADARREEAAGLTRHAKSQGVPGGTSTEEAKLAPLGKAGTTKPDAQRATERQSGVADAEVPTSATAAREQRTPTEKTEKPGSAEPNATARGPQARPAEGGTAATKPTGLPAKKEPRIPGAGSEESIARRAAAARHPITAPEPKIIDAAAAEAAAAAAKGTDPSVKRLLVPQAKAQVVGRIELPQETIRDATRRSAPATARDSSADRNLRRAALHNTQSRTAARPNTGPAARRGSTGGMGSRSTSGSSRMSVRRGRGGPAIASSVDPNKIIEIEPPISIKGLSEALGIKVNDLIATLTFKLNVKGKTINSFLTPEEVELVGLACERNIRIVERREAETELIRDMLEEAADEASVARAPVVTFMGHVDHGKTSLLDALRKSDVAKGEAGGITQHIGAYKIATVDDRAFVVLDTPGHAAFTSMRARGANVTDIIVLVVAADDGVMPQTEEAISHARAAKDSRGQDVPIIVAINKCDKPQANPMQVRQQLAVKGLQPEEWGGTTQMINVSATTGAGLEELIDAIMLVAEAEIDLKCRPSAAGQGTVIEVKQTPEQGVLVNVLVTDGTLRVKDKIICGNCFARVRALLDDHGNQIEEAGPSTPVQVFGLSELPQPGDKLFVVTAENQEKAKEVIEDRQRRARDMSLAERSTVTLETLNAALAARKIQEIKIILKADVMGSLEPIKKILGDLSTEEVRINIIHSGLGGITETDVELAAASKAIIIGFNSVADSAARQSAERQGVETRFYDVIYSVVDDMRAAMEGLLAPERVEKVIGHADIRALFKSSKFGNIAGCYITDGMVTRNSKVRLLRDGKILYTGELGSLKRLKDDVREVKANFECGLTIANYNDIREGDKLEFFAVEMVKRTLE